MSWKACKVQSLLVLCVSTDSCWISRSQGIAFVRDRHLDKQKFTFNEWDQKLFVGFEFFRVGFDFFDSGFDIGLWELVWSFSHVLESEIISFQELEVISS